MPSVILVTFVFAILCTTWIGTVDSMVLKIDASNQTALESARSTDVPIMGSQKTFWHISYKCGDPLNPDATVFLQVCPFAGSLKNNMSMIGGQVEFGLLRLPELSQLIFFASMGNPEGMSQGESNVFELRESIKNILKVDCDPNTLIICDPAKFTEDNLRKCIENKSWKII